MDRFAFEWDGVAAAATAPHIDFVGRRRKLSLGNLAAAKWHWHESL